MSGTSPATIVSDMNLATPNVAKGPWRFIPIPLTHLRTSANPPAILTGATTPPIVFSSNTEYVTLTSTTGCIADITIPWDAQDFDTASASPYTRGVELMLVGRARIVNAAETAILTGVAYAQGGGTYASSSATLGSTKALSASFTGAFKVLDINTPTAGKLARVVSTTAFSQLANAVDTFAIDFSDALDSGNLRIQPGDGVVFTIAADSSSVGNINILSLGLAYRTNLAFTNRALRAW